MTCRTSFAGLGAVCVVLVVLAPGVLAQWTTEAADPGLPAYSPEWGITAPIAYNVPGFTFVDLGDTQHANMSGFIYTSAGSNPYLSQSFYLPSGAVLEGMTTYFYDADVSADALLNLYRVTGTTTSGFTLVQLILDTSTGSGGFQGGYHAITPETIRNVNPQTGEVNQYLLQLHMDPSSTTTDLRFGGVTIWYRLQMSPAPASATFGDVPTGYWAFRHIEALAASGITAGCGGGNFCPENYVKRSEMAVYLAKALGLHWPDGIAITAPSQ